MGIRRQRIVIGSVAVIAVIAALLWFQPWNPGGNNTGAGSATGSSTSAPTPSPTRTTPIIRATPRASTPSATPTTAKRSLKCYFGPDESDYITYLGAKCPGTMQESPVEWNTPTANPRTWLAPGPADPKLQEWLEQYGRNGTQQEPPAKCTPGYSPCLPPASDYDCIRGPGDGPAYTGRVYVTGPDIYGLDGDGDGIGCE